MIDVEDRICKKCERKFPLIDFPLRNKIGILRSYVCLNCSNEHRRIKYANGPAPHYDVCSIYIIKNTVNSKVYIGQTWRDLSVRWRSHLIPSTANHCVKLRRAIKKYGQQNFSIQLITTCYTQVVVDFYEKHFIHQFNSIKNGYNVLEGGGLSRKGTKHSNKTIKKMSLARQGEGNANSILNRFQVDQIKKEYKNYSNPRTGSKYGAITFLSKKYNVAISTIFEIVKGQAW